MSRKNKKDVEVDFFQEYRDKDIKKLFHIERIVLVDNRQMVIVDNNAKAAIQGGWLKVVCIEDDVENLSFLIHPRRLLLADPRLKQELDEFAIKFDPTQVELNKKHKIIEGQQALDLFDC